MKRMWLVAAAVVLAVVLVALARRGCGPDPEAEFRAWIEAAAARLPDEPPGAYRAYTHLDSAAARERWPALGGFALRYFGRDRRIEASDRAVFEREAESVAPRVAGRRLTVVVAEVSRAEGAGLPPEAMRAACLLRDEATRQMVGVEVVGVPNPERAADPDLPPHRRFLAVQVGVFDRSEMIELTRRHLLDLR